MARTKPPPKKATAARTAGKQPRTAPSKKAEPKKKAQKAKMQKLKGQGRYKYRAGTRTDRDLRKYLIGEELLIPKLPFQRVVRELAEKEMAGVRLQSSAIGALQWAVEAFSVDMFTRANGAAIHARRLTIQQKDIWLWKKMTNFDGKTKYGIM
ncbi:hypothetical protein LTR36_007314 [Oleoguttula mirabilis]|uniref:Core Histone H2A/H2B/H3 domain-containing protein n=1 Tax=Oleoguttula mirabilis TaxID=1507867 RepID=A0AAV9J9I5_9PEZI|nr:hypothetical protein LTR36_007314 [Oleoguttula mirabilis]